MWMKRLALALCVVLAVCACPGLAEQTDSVMTSEGGIPYSQSDVATLRAYLDVDANGTLVKPTYSPDDPETYGVTWEEIDGEYRAVAVEWYEVQIGGELSLAGMECLRTLFVSRNQLTKLNLAGCYQLTDVYCDGNQLTELNLTGCVSLSELVADENLLTEVDLSDCVSLTSLFISGNTLGALHLDNLPALTLAQCDYNLIEELTAKGCQGLESLYCQNNSLPFLSLAGCGQLKTLNAQDNLLLAVNLTGCDQLTSLNLGNNRLTALPDLTGCAQLSAQDTSFQGNEFEEEDLTLLPQQLKDDPQWVAAQITVDSALLPSGEAEPVSEEEPEYDLTSLGDILTNRQGSVWPYEAAASRETEGWAMVVSALPNNEKYHQRNLTLSTNTLLEMQEAGYYEIALRMNDVAVFIPISELLEVDAASFTLLIAPMASDEWNDAEKAALNGRELLSTACRYRAVSVKSSVQDNITDALDGLVVRAYTSTPQSPEAVRLFRVSNQEATQGDTTYYVPSRTDLGENSVFAADLSGAGSGLIGLVTVSD